METPIAEIRAFLDNSTTDGVQEPFSGLIIKEDELGWELYPYGDKRVVCLPPGDKNSPFYHPWIGYRSPDGIKLYHYVNTGFKEIPLPEQTMEEDGPVLESIQMDEEVEGDETWLNDMMNKFSNNY